MGIYFADQYSLLHFATGVIAYFWGVSITQWILLHTIFELLENTPQGIRFINTSFKGLWPGGKPHADSLINSIGDTIFATIGWYIAFYLDYIGSQKGYYPQHLD